MSLQTIVKSAIAALAACVNARRGGAGSNAIKVSFADGVLTVCGEGSMSDFLNKNGYNWRAFGVANVAHVRRIVFDGAVENVFSAISFKSDFPKLESVTLPSTLRAVPDRAFKDCTSLREVTLPDGLRAIGHHAFSGCASLRAIHIPASVESIAPDAFSGCPAT